MLNADQNLQAFWRSVVCSKPTNDVCKGGFSSDTVWHKLTVCPKEIKVRLIRKKVFRPPASVKKQERVGEESSEQVGKEINCG